MKQSINRVLLALTSVLTLGMNLFAQADPNKIGQGVQALEKTQKQIVGYFNPVADIIYIIAAIVGLIGAIKVYSKFSSGDPDTGKTAASWFGAAIFIVVAVYALKAMFID